MYDYFYGQQAELFSFYRVPKVLFTDEKFSNISSDAKLLYGIMLTGLISTKIDFANPTSACSLIDSACAVISFCHNYNPP